MWAFGDEGTGVRGFTAFQFALYLAFLFAVGALAIWRIVS
jgi:hypothetical protein